MSRQGFMFIEHKIINPDDGNCGKLLLNTN